MSVCALSFRLLRVELPTVRDGADWARQQILASFNNAHVWVTPGFFSAGSDRSRVVAGVTDVGRYR
jgi:hypothetical protein